MGYCQSVMTQIGAYNALREEDMTELREEGIIDDENDLSSPKGLFKVVHDQALDDGYINDLTSILKNLITIPASGDIVWTNLAKIVQSACNPTQSKYTNGDQSKSQNTYLSFKELQHLLKVQAVEEEKEKEIEAKHNDIEIKLNEERKKVSEFEKQVQELQNIITDLKSGAIGNGGGLPPPTVYSPVPVSNGLPPPIPNGGGLPAPIPSSGGLPAPIPSSVSLPAPIPTAVSDNDGLDKFRKMVKMKVPKAAIVNKMRQAGIDTSIIQKYELTGNLPAGSGGSNIAAAPAPIPSANGL